MMAQSRYDPITRLSKNLSIGIRKDFGKDAAVDLALSVLIDLGAGNIQTQVKLGSLNQEFFELYLWLKAITFELDQFGSVITARAPNRIHELLGGLKDLAQNKPSSFLTVRAKQGRPAKDWEQREKWCHAIAYSESYPIKDMRDSAYRKVARLLDIEAKTLKSAYETIVKADGVTLEKCRILVSSSLLVEDPDNITENRNLLLSLINNGPTE